MEQSLAGEAGDECVERISRPVLPQMDHPSPVEAGLHRICLWDATRKLLERIDRQVSMIDNVVTALADVAKLPDADLAPIALEPILRGVIDSMNLPSNLRIEFEFPEYKGRPALKMIWYDGGDKGERPSQELMSDLPKLTDEKGKTSHFESAALIVGDKGKFYSPGDYGGEARGR